MSFLRCFTYYFIVYYGALLNYELSSSCINHFPTLNYTKSVAVQIFLSTVSATLVLKEKLRFASGGADS